MKNFKVIDCEGHTEYAWGYPSHLYFNVCSNGNVFMGLSIGDNLLNILAYSGDTIPTECKNEIETILLNYVLKAINRGDVVINFADNPYIVSSVKEIIEKHK